MNAFSGFVHLFKRVYEKRKFYFFFRCRFDSLL